MSSIRTRTTFLLAVAGASAVALTIYLASLSAHYTADGLLYALSIESGSAADLFDPTHLLLHPLGWLWYQLWLALGWSGQAILPLQVLNALAGAAAVGLLAATAGRLVSRRAPALLAATGFALSGGTWLLSVEAEFVTPALVPALFALFLLAGAPRRLWGRPYLRPVALALATAAAALSYLSNLFLAPAILLRLWGRGRRPALLYLGLLAGLLLPLGAAVLWLWAAVGGGGPEALFGPESYGRSDLASLPGGAYAFLRSLALFRGLAMNDSTADFLAAAAPNARIGFASYYLLTGLLAALPVAYAWLRRKTLCASERGMFLPLALWAGLHAAFALFWVPGDISFWLPVLAAWWLLAAVVLDDVLGRVTLAGGRRWFLGAAAAAVLALGLLNYVMLIGPRRDLASNSRYRLALEVRDQTEPEALIFADPDDLDTLFVAYFGGRQPVLAPVYRQGWQADYGDWLATAERAYVLRDGRLQLLAREEP